MSQTPNKLQKIYYFDFWFMIASASTLILAGMVLGPLIIPDISTLWFIAVGVGLLPWAFFNRYLSNQTHPKAPLFGINVTGDILWVFTSIVALIFAREWLTGFGVIAVVAIAMAVGELAWLKLSNRRHISAGTTALPQSS
ncbi:MAG: hypothetical protein COB78_11305 [Hyphomicrobiales bacterium]|nr:MAG: hypothetical protein COB78_11305 [Hyphomicrobiales bacterium]